MDTQKLTDEILRLKREKDAVIMAHFYVPAEVQAVADFVGDSFFLSRKGTELSNAAIVLAGVRFMAESCKVLNPEKTVLLPAPDADCPMAHMASVSRIREVKAQYGEDVAVVCYVNSTADIKAESDVCVTSANAVKVVSGLPQKKIFFVPDQNLARFVAKQLPEKEFIFNDGYCHVHNGVQTEDVLELKSFYPAAPVLMHPECREEVLALADSIGSTSGIIRYAKESPEKEFIIITECGVLAELQKECPGKTFHFLPLERGAADTKSGYGMVCPNMKKVTLDKVYSALETGEEAIALPDDIMEKAKLPMERMLALS